MNLSAILSPAYALEHYAYGEPIENPFLNETVPRVAAIAAPFLHLAQTVAYFSVGLVDLTLCVFRITPGILLQFSGTHTAHSAINLVASIKEVPEKVIFGSHRCPNYSGDPQRYDRKDLSERIELM